MSDHGESSPEEAIEISIKKTNKDHPLKEKKKIVKQKAKSKPIVPSKIQSLLQDTIEDQKILK